MYLRLLRLPGVGRLVLASVVAGLPATMNVTAEALLVQRSTGSFATAGAVTGASSVALAVSSPVLGRLVDKVGQTRVLVPAVALYTAALWGLVAAAQAHAPALVLGLCAVAIGVGVPPTAACRRALWPGVLAGTEVLVATAYALDSIIVEALFILGPLLAAALIALASPALAIVVGGALALVGTGSFAVQPASRGWRPDATGARSWAGPLRAPGVRVVAAALLPFGAAFGTLDLAFPAFAVAHGAPAANGLFWAGQAAGSALGGLLYGSRRWRGALPGRWALLFAAFAVGLAPLALAGSIGALVALVALGALTLAPVTAVSFELIDRLAPAGTRTEAFTWVITANLAGSAAGAAVAGGLVQHHGARAGFLLACGVALAGAALAAALRGKLRGAET